MAAEQSQLKAILPGILLMAATVIAMLLSNLSGTSEGFLNFWQIKPESVNGLIGKDLTLVLWVNDLLMAIFFLLVGLEVKREFMVGALSKPGSWKLPVIAAVGGMMFPALIYSGINLGEGGQLKGWAIPAATDIAFALGVLSLFGKRVPIALKILLLTIAVADDLMAIIVIAVFYTEKMSVSYLLMSLIPLVVLLGLNRAKIMSLPLYMLVGTVLWYFVLKSGVHATIAGVLLGLTVPMAKPGEDSDHGPLLTLEHGLAPWVNFMILPIFALANAAVSLDGVGVGDLLHPVPLGIIAGLFIGKQIGIFGFIWLSVKSKVAAMPEGLNWLQVHALTLLCGIGFTMSLFIGGLAFASIKSTNLELYQSLEAGHKLGILLASLLSIIVGGIYLLLILPKANEGKDFPTTPIEA